MKPHSRKASRLTTAVAIGGLLLACGGCHGGKQGGTYQAARPAYPPEPKKPLFISGYAGGGLKPRPENRSFRPTAEEASRPRRLRWGEIKDGLGL
jgi:hypothetical protein